MTTIERLAAFDPRQIRYADPETPGEVELHEANRRSHEHGIAVLQQMMPGLPWTSLVQGVDANTLHVGRAAPGFIQRLGGLDVVDGFFGGPEVGAAGIKLFRDGSDVPAAAYLQLIHAEPLGALRPDLGVLTALLDDGFTAVLDGYDLRSRAAMQLTEATERAFGSACSINGYLSVRTHTSFGAHWDDQEVVIIQLLGRKRWEVHRPRALSMERTLHGSDVAPDPVWDGEIQPGGILYVPRGWGHRVTGVDEVSLHLTLTIPRFNGLGALSTILEREAVDRGGVEIVGGIEDAARSVQQLITAPDARGAQAFMRSRMTSRSTQRLSDFEALVDGRDVGPLLCRSTNAGGLLVIDDGHAEARLASHGIGITLDRGAVADLAALCDGSARPITDGNRALVIAACRAGILDVCRPADVIWP